MHFSLDHNGNGNKKYYKLIGNERGYGYDRLIETCKKITVNEKLVYDLDGNLNCLPFDQGSQGSLGQYTFCFDKK